jgi:hypothetical protein
VELSPACGDAGLLGHAVAIGSAQVGGVELGTGEPNGLCQESQEQETGQKLRAAEAFAREKSRHKGEPSVLP